MKLKIFFFIALILVSVPMQTTRALTCAPFFPQIGIVNDTLAQETYAEIILEKFYTFDQPFFDENAYIIIDRYEILANEYLNNNLASFQETPPQYSAWVGAIPIPIDSLEKVRIESGDIIINGPPIYGCGYGFTGIFTADGKLKSVIIDDNFQSYSYRNNNLEVKTGEELTCDESDICKVKINFKLNDESFTLSPNQSHVFSGGPIKSISLTDSSKINGGLFSSDYLNTYANYILNFSDSDLGTQSSHEQTIPTKILNFFGNIWNGFISLFR